METERPSERSVCGGPCIREEIWQLGDNWVERGAPVEEAVIQYHPGELECLTEGLIEYIQNSL